MDTCAFILQRSLIIYTTRLCSIVPFVTWGPKETELRWLQATIRWICGIKDSRRNTTMATELLYYRILASRTLHYSYSGPSLWYKSSYAPAAAHGFQMMSSAMLAQKEILQNHLFATMTMHYAKLSRAMRAPWVDRFLNNEIYCYPLSKKWCRPPLRSPPARRSEGIVISGRQQRNDNQCNGNNFFPKKSPSKCSTWHSYYMYKRQKHIEE